jgi:hypothetical protein
VTAYDNIVRGLKALGLDDAVEITSLDEDRVWGWPVGSRLFAYMIQNKWNLDISAAADSFHGTKYSFREPGGVHPALQICYHAHKEKPFVEIDFDLSAPNGGIGSFFGHAWEVVSNTVLRRKTDQARVAKLLDKRFQASKG